MPQIESLNISLGVAILSDGQSVPITNAFDSDGDECDLLSDDVVVLVAGSDRTGWYVVPMSECETGAAA